MSDCVIGCMADGMSDYIMMVCLTVSLTDSLNLVV